MERNTKEARMKYEEQDNPEEYYKLTDVDISVPSLESVDKQFVGQNKVLTIVAQGPITSYEITVSDQIDVLERSPRSDCAFVSGRTTEGTIQTGYVQFIFTGDITDIKFLSGHAKCFINEMEIDNI